MPQTAVQLEQQATDIVERLYNKNYESFLETLKSMMNPIADSNRIISVDKHYLEAEKQKIALKKEDLTNKLEANATSSNQYAANFCNLLAFLTVAAMVTLIPLLAVGGGAFAGGAIAATAVVGVTTAIATTALSRTFNKRHDLNVITQRGEIQKLTDKAGLLDKIMIRVTDIDVEKEKFSIKKNQLQEIKKLGDFAKKGNPLEKAKLIHRAIIKQNEIMKSEKKVVDPAKATKSEANILLKTLRQEFKDKYEESNTYVIGNRAYIIDQDNHNVAYSLDSNFELQKIDIKFPSDLSKIDLALKLEYTLVMGDKTKKEDILGKYSKILSDEGKEVPGDQDKLLQKYFKEKQKYHKKGQSKDLTAENLEKCSELDLSSLEIHAEGDKKYITDNLFATKINLAKEGEIGKVLIEEYPDLGACDTSVDAADHFDDTMEAVREIILDPAALLDQDDKTLLGNVYGIFRQAGLSDFKKINYTSQRLKGKTHDSSITYMQEQEEPDHASFDASTAVNECMNTIKAKVKEFIIEGARKQEPIELQQRDVEDVSGAGVVVEDSDILEDITDSLSLLKLNKLSGLGSTDLTTQEINDFAFNQATTVSADAEREINATNESIANLGTTANFARSGGGGRGR